MKILTVDISPNGEQSASRNVASYLLNQLKKKDSAIVTRDLARHPLPHLDGKTIQAFFTPLDARSPELKEAIKISDLLVDEVLAADAIIISTPMWNFGPPSVLKAWIDHIIRAGRTFSFTSEGLVALATGKKVFVVMSSGSVFSEGFFAPMDALTVSLKSALGFIGLTDVEFIRVEGTNTPETRDTAIQKAKAYVDQILK